MGVDLTALFDGVRQTQAMNDPYSAENMAKQIGSFDYGIDESGALPQMPDTDQGEDIAVKAFKPKKRSILGLIGDAILLNQGHKGPFFADRIKRKNYERAFEGMTNDPMEVIRRVSTFDPEAAWKMRGQLADDERADKTQDRLMGKDNDSRLKSISGLANVAVSNPQHREAAIGRYNDMLTKWGMDEYLLPDDVDDATLTSIAMGVVPPDKQEMQKIRERRTTMQERDTDSKIERRDVQNRNDTTRVGQGQQRINQAQQRINIAKDKAKAQIVTGKSGQKYEVMDIRDAKGFVRRVVLDRKAGTAYSTSDQGTIINYVIKGDQLVKTGEEPAE